MEYYETDDIYTLKEINEFIKWFSDEIGTDYELNESASGEPDEYYVMFMDLTWSEVQKIREYELGLRKL